MALAFTINGIISIQSGVKNNTYVEDTAVKPVAAFLETQLEDNDLVIVSTCSNPRYWYYFERANLPDQVIRTRKRYFENIYVIAYLEENPSCKAENLEKILENFGPDAQFLNMDEIELVFNYEYADVYKLGTYPEKIQSAFPAENETIANTE